MLALMAYMAKMKCVSLAEARDHLSVLVNDAAHGGHRIVLSSRGRPKAALIGMDDLRRLELTGAAATTISQEMLRWIERVEGTVHARPRVANASATALREAREAEGGGRNGVPRRKPRTQAARRRGR